MRGLEGHRKLSPMVICLSVTAPWHSLRDDLIYPYEELCLLVQESYSSLVLAVDNLGRVLDFSFLLFSSLVLAHSSQSFIREKVRVVYQLDITVALLPNPAPLPASLIRTSWAKPHLAPTQMLGFRS